MTVQITTGDREITATRIFDAPRDLVWRAFTDPDHLKHWWGPTGFTNTFHSFDFKEGGLWRFTMHGPDGTNYENENRFIKIDWLERIVIDHLCAPLFRATMTFEDLGEKTRLTFHQQFETAEIYQWIKPIAMPGLTEMLERLAARLPAIDPLRRELTISRSFDAPRALVWQAWTDPTQLAKWWGPNGFTNPICEIDLRVGGEIHIVMRGPDGTDYPMRGMFKEIVAPEKLVFTNFPVDAQDQPMIDGWTSVTFAERDGKTDMTLHTRAIGLVERAAFMIMGMGAGWSQSIERLAELLGHKA
jgi:uncharacterized protein YndB with AHSA1/START domain